MNNIFNFNDFLNEKSNTKLSEKECIKLVDKYMKENDFNNEPMDGDDTVKMADFYAKKMNWSAADKKYFLKCADEYQGNK